MILRDIFEYTFFFSSEKCVATERGNERNLEKYDVVVE